MNDDRRLIEDYLPIRQSAWYEKDEANFNYCAAARAAVNPDFSPARPAG